MEPPIDLSALTDAVRHCCGHSIAYQLRCPSDAIDILQRFDLPNPTRLLCWLLQFDILLSPSGRWPSDLFRLGDEYSRLIASHLDDCADPLRNIPAASRRVVHADTTRDVGWFSRHARDLGVDPELQSDVVLRCSRVISALSVSAIEFVYTQGYDRFVFVTYLVGLEFCAWFGIERQFAEAVCFRLSREFINLVQISDLLAKPRVTEANFVTMDGDMMEYAPEVMQRLRKVGQSSIHFALRWEILLFADEYDVRPLLLLWDHAIIHRKEYKKWLHWLCVGHIRQFRSQAGNEALLEKTQRFRDWNIEQAVEFANQEIATTLPSRKWKLVACFGIAILPCFFIWLLRRKLSSI
jgi:hypothetical protein